MSILFGIQKPSGAIATGPELLRLAEATGRFAFDGVSVKAMGCVGMGFQPYYTHARSTLETEPACDGYGNLVTFDGRLDNYVELCAEFGLNALAASDSQIVLAAFVKWGERCFSRFIGDWALALWSSKEQELYLARDHAGTRTLYLQSSQGTFRWSSYLETFFVDDTTVKLDEDYIACYLALQPVHNLTPYKDIQSILPAHYLVIRNGRVASRSHWDWMKEYEIRYSTDREYEEQFLALFKQSVLRRTGPGAPILAHLSGGMDSSSIVCISDFIRQTQNPNAELLDTLSFFDDSDPNWNERPFFSAVEEKRGKSGAHLKMSFKSRTFEPLDAAEGVYLMPGADSSVISDERRLEAVFREGGFRSVLSGLGGDELLGAVPTGLPELAGHFISGDILRLFRQAISWSLVDRSPLALTLYHTLKYSCEVYQQPEVDAKRVPPWLAEPLQRRCIRIKREYITRKSLLGLRPDAIGNGLAWWSIMETLPHRFPWLLARPEYRYPYLDRQLVDFLLGVPRSRLIRPGRRRSLMRQALTGIVPQELLERRRKAFQIRTPLAVIQQSHWKIEALFAHSLISEYGFINPQHLRDALELTIRGSDTRWWQALIKTIMFELWLRTRLIGSQPAESVAGPFTSYAHAVREQTNSV